MNSKKIKILYVIFLVSLFDYSMIIGEFTGQQKNILLEDFTWAINCEYQRNDGTAFWRMMNMSCLNKIEY